MGYLGCVMAIKDPRTNQGDFNKIFRVCSIDPMYSCYSTSDKRFFWEIIYWKYLSHSNILPLVKAPPLTELHHFRIRPEWMPNGNLIQHTKIHPEANGLHLGSLPPAPPQLPLLSNHP